jgi:hypothetical protein
MSPSPMRPLRKNEYVGIKRYRSRAQKLRAWARRKANAEPEQVFTPWLPLEPVWQVLDAGHPDLTPRIHEQPR